MEGVAIERRARRLCAGERRDQRHFRRVDQRQRGHRGGRADVAEECERSAVDQLAGVGGAALGLAAVVEAAQFDLPATDAAARVGALEHELCAELELLARRARRAGERGRMADHQTIAQLRERRCAQAGEREGAC